MEYPVSENDTRFRGRHVNATEADMAAFIADMSAAFPEARLFIDLNSAHKDYPEIPRVEAARLYGSEDSFMVVFDPKWQAKTAPYEAPHSGYNVLNVPYPLVRFKGCRIDAINAEELGRTIRVCREGMVDGQCAKDNKDDARVVDKVLRIQRKHLHKKAEVFDLKTGKSLGIDDCTYWYGPDMGRRSREEEDLYLQVRFYRDRGEILGYKAPA